MGFAYYRLLYFPYVRDDNLSVWSMEYADLLR